MLRHGPTPRVLGLPVLGSLVAPWVSNHVPSGGVAVDDVCCVPTLSGLDHHSAVPAWCGQGLSKLSSDALVVCVVAPGRRAWALACWSGAAGARAEPAAVETRSEWHSASRFTVTVQGTGMIAGCFTVQLPAQGAEQAIETSHGAPIRDWRSPPGRALPARRRCRPCQPRRLPCSGALPR